MVLMSENRESYEKILNYIYEYMNDYFETEELNLKSFWIDFEQTMFITFQTIFGDIINSI